MGDDKQQIRDLIETWAQASAAGDLDKILSLMDEDAIFLVAGHPPMRGRKEFAAQFKTAVEQVRIEATNDIQEIEISGDLAYCRNNLTVTLTPLKGGAPNRRTGFTLTIFRRKEGGNWVLSRDANLLSEAAE